MNTFLLCILYKIRVLPTVVIFNDGISKERITGFEGLSEGMMPGREDEWPTSRLQERLLACGGIAQLVPLPSDDALLHSGNYGSFVGQSNHDHVSDSNSHGQSGSGWGSTSARRFGDDDDFLDEDDF